MKINKTLIFSGYTISFLLVGYLGVQYFGRNTMYTIAASVGGAGAISYVLYPSGQSRTPTAPIKTQRRRNKS